MIPSNEIRKEGISLLEKMFKDKSVHQSVIYLLKNTVKDEKFVQEARPYGIDLVSKSV